MYTIPIIVGLVVGALCLAVHRTVSKIALAQRIRETRRIAESHGDLLQRIRESGEYR